MTNAPATATSVQIQNSGYFLIMNLDNPKALTNYSKGWIEN